MIQNDKKRNKPKIAVLFVLFKNANKNLLNNFSSYVDILIKTSAIGFLIAQKKKNLPLPRSSEWDWERRGWGNQLLY